MERRPLDPEHLDPLSLSTTLEGLSAILLELAAKDLSLEKPLDTAVQTRLISLADALHLHAKLLADYLDK